MKAKDKLLDAYLLIRENNSVLTVVELCNLASVNRSSFYRHFSSIDNVEEYAVQTATDALISAVEKYNYDTDASELIDIMLSDIIEKKRLFQMCFGSKPAKECYERFYSYIRDKTLEVWTHESKQSAEAADILLTYILSGSAGILSMWYRNGFSPDIDTMKKLIQGVVPYGIYEFIYTV